MTRKDYIAMAGYLRDLQPTAGHYQRARWQEFVDYLCTRFKQDNKAFDADKFRAACQLGDVERNLADEAPLREIVANYHKNETDD